MGKIKIPGADSWQPVVDSDPERLKESVAKMRQALAEDEKRERERPSGLPKHWPGIILKAAAT